MIVSVMCERIINHIRYSSTNDSYCYISSIMSTIVEVDEDTVLLADILPVGPMRVGP